MGLDQWAFATKGEEMIEIQTWRKHPALEFFMEGLYRERGGCEEFNCIKIKLLKEDLLLLQANHKRLSMAKDSAWESLTVESKIQQTDDFIEQALALQREGYEIIYSSWW